MNLEQLARDAAVEASSAHAVGDFLEVVDEAEPNVVTYLFDSKLKGYVGWRWSVSIFQADQEQPSISEVNLVAGENSVLAPKWIPWSERLADYKALQAALEQQAAEEAAALAEEAERAAADAADGAAEAEPLTDEDDDFAEVEEIGVDDQDEDSLAATSSDDNAEQTEGDSEEAGANPPSFFRIFRRGKKRK